MQKNNVEVKNVDSTIFNSEYENAFDTVLCDAPCSGTGVLKENPDIKLKRTLDSVLELTKTQKALLDNLSKYVKVGGGLCYSTCSILKKENDGVIKKFLSNHKNYVVEEITSPLNGYKTDYGITFMPHLSMGAGFYFCKLRRVE
jgi:16S rRNA (cytosine967-C5)-methyltransferase